LILILSLPTSGLSTSIRAGEELLYSTISTGLVVLVDFFYQTSFLWQRICRGLKEVVFYYVQAPFVPEMATPLLAELRTTPLSKPGEDNGLAPMQEG
jgi:hypothetical protein